MEIINKNECMGCHACYNICPKKAIIMEDNDKGFKVYKIDESKCIKCGLCKKVCPVLNRTSIENHPEAFAIINRNTEIRKQSSSGGVFSLLAEYIIEKNGVVFGVGFDENWKVRHCYVEKKEDINIFRGSKYVQSTIGDSYKKVKDFLDDDRYVLFTGTPCQIEGLKSYLRKDYDKLYTQDIICHGVPSPRVWQKYLEEMNQKNKGKLEKINFRKKDITGWNLYQISLKYSNSEYRQIHKKDPYMQAFLGDIILRDSCYSCKFKKKNRISDITLADFWGIKNIKPSMDDDKGTSLVILNSKKGKELINKIEDKIEKAQVNFEDAIKYNPSMTMSAHIPSKRKEFFEEFQAGKNIDKLVKKYVPKTNIIKRILRKIKQIITNFLKH